MNILPTPTPCPTPFSTPDMQKAQNVFESAKNFFDNMNKFLYAVSHPIVIWHGFVDFSFWFCCIGGMICIIIGVVSGHKKFQQWAVIFGVSYVIIKAVDLAIC